MNIEDPAVSRLLAEALQWRPLAEKRAILDKVPALATIAELQALLDDLKGASPPEGDFRRVAREAGRALAQALQDNEA